MTHTAEPLTLPREWIGEDNEVHQLIPRSVILYNDDVHEFYEVTQGLRRSVEKLTAQEAESITIEAHEKGRSLVISCPLEQAELYSERLGTYGLTTSIE